MPEKTNYLTGKRFETSYFFEKSLIRNVQDDRYHQSSLYCPDPPYYLIKTAKSTHKEHENKKIKVAQPQYRCMGLYQDLLT